jgi:hypothetical protein
LTLGEDREKIILEIKMTIVQEGNPLPDWIVKRQREKTEQDHKAEEMAQRQLEAAKLVQEGGSEFWQHLIDRLAFNVKALTELPEEELAGSVSPMGGAMHSPELSYHIQVNRQSVRLGPELSKMNLWYQPGGARIRRWYQDRKMEDITLQPGRQGVVAIIDDNMPMTAERLGDHIVSWMADRVRA